VAVREATEAFMDPLISDLLGRYEQGRLSRRDLVAGLSALAAGATVLGAPAKAQEPAPIVPATVDHVSILTDNLEGSVAFYERVFGLRNVSEDVENKIVRLAAPTSRGALVSLREEPPAGLVDHWAFRVEGFDRATATAALEAHGLTPAENLEFGFHVRDPNGVVVQLV
jgi:catechol 2,3-dioxygenase-like lactoylglutathione lyase family enzyme